MPGAGGVVSERLEFYRSPYGYCRVNRELRKSDIAVGAKRVLSIIQKLRLQAKGATRSIAG